LKIKFSTSAPGGVATGQRLSFGDMSGQTHFFSSCNPWPVATAPGSDVEHFLCKAVPRPI
jgi:hypothetical protein